MNLLFNDLFLLQKFLIIFFLGSVSSEKSKMLDITRDKPIKVAVRVAVPVRDHPKVINFFCCCLVVFVSGIL